MSVFFQPYEGRRPYVFISYSHRDSDAVLRIISELNDRKLRLWYDEGIPAGSDWPKNIELHMRGCAAVLFFLSNTALASPNCYSEIRTAVALKKPILLIPLEPTEPDNRWRELLARAETVSDAEHPSEAIRAWRVLRRSFYRRWTDSFRAEWIGLFAALLLFGAASFGLFLLISGRFDPPEPPQPTVTATPDVSEATPEPVPQPSIDPSLFPVSFPDSQQEDGVRLMLGKSEGDILRPELADLTELYFCGNQVMRSMDGVSLATDGTIVSGTSKILLSGKISDLSVIGLSVYLRRLALVGQPLGSLEPLNNLVLLEELYLSGSTVGDLSALNGLSSLRVLHIEHTDVRDLTPLGALPSLRTVTVSADMLPLEWPKDKPFTVILVP